MRLQIGLPGVGLLLAVVFSPSGLVLSVGGSDLGLVGGLSLRGGIVAGSVVTLLSGSGADGEEGGGESEEGFGGEVHGCFIEYGNYISH